MLATDLLQCVRTGCNKHDRAQSITSALQKAWYQYWYRLWPSAVTGVATLYILFSSDINAVERCNGASVFPCVELHFQLPTRQEILYRSQADWQVLFYFILQKTGCHVAVLISGVNNKLLQLVEKRCCTASNIVTQQNFVVASWSSVLLQQVEPAPTFFNKFNFLNLQPNKISFLQVEATCCCSKLNRRLLFSTN